MIKLQLASCNLMLHGRNESGINRVGICLEGARAITVRPLAEGVDE
jgi:hypothetical protein